MAWEWGLADKRNSKWRYVTIKYEDIWTLVTSWCHNNSCYAVVNKNLKWHCSWSQTIDFISRYVTLPSCLQEFEPWILIAVLLSFFGTIISMLCLPRKKGCQIWHVVHHMFTYATGSRERTFVCLFVYNLLLDEISNRIGSWMVSYTFGEHTQLHYLDQGMCECMQESLAGSDI